MKKIIQFRRGQIVKSGNNMVLVTGKGSKKEAGYDCFAGVVVFGKKMHEDDHTWQVGMYSETWSTIAFKKTGLPMNTIMNNVDKLLKK